MSNTDQLVSCSRRETRCMEELEEELRKQDLLSQQQVLDRFRKVFKREMTPIERKAFFLPSHPPLLEKH